MHDESPSRSLERRGGLTETQIQGRTVTKIRKLPTLLRGMEAHPPPPPQNCFRLGSGFLQHTRGCARSYVADFGATDWSSSAVCLPARPTQISPFGVVNATHVLSMFAPGGVLGGIIVCHDRRSWTGRLC
jgi:hypothetical protein